MRSKFESLETLRPQMALTLVVLFVAREDKDHP